MKGFNENEINDFIRWTTHIPVQIRFIEFMPFSGNRWTGNKVFSMQDMFSEIGTQFEFLPVENELHDTAKHFMIPGHVGSFAIISTMSAPFCSDCNRMRLTADGKLKNCLFSTGETDLLTAAEKSGRCDSADTCIHPVKGQTTGRTVFRHIRYAGCCIHS